MSTGDALPVLVGVGAVTGAGDAEALDLMVAAVEAAGGDAGVAGVVDRIGWIGVPEGTWGYTDPGRLLGERFGRRDAFTVRADVGRTQQELIGRACTAVSIEGVEVALVVGGEAKHRAERARRAGEPAVETTQPAGVEPDEVLAAGSLGIDDLEIIRNTVVPATSYALIENALAAASGLSVDGHQARLGALYERFAAVAAANPDAWDRTGPLAVEIVTPSAANRLLASPYTKRLCSQWNVDQAAALLITSVGTARALGVPTDRWVFGHSSVVANQAVPLPARAELHRSPGAEAAGRRVLELAGIGVDDLAVIDLYSAFPATVQVHAAAVGLPLSSDRALTQTGGMSFAGGPLNNYVLQAMVKLADALRAAGRGYGLSTSVSGFLTKSGFGIWSTEPPATGRFAAAEVPAASDARTVVAELPAGAAARIVSSTVVPERGGPARAVAVVEAADGPVRSIVESREPAVVEALLASPRIDALVSDLVHM